jgi:polyhydroxybutyrate depolymerase
MPVAATARRALTAPRPRPAVLLLLAAACAGDRPPPSGFRSAIRVDDVTRTFVLYAPPAARRGPAAPLLLAFHGTGESGVGFRRAAGLDAVAARAGWLVAYPDAAVGHWAENCDCTEADRLGVNDTGFVRRLIDSVASRFPVDRSRVVAAGFSQGGLFVHRLACELADRVAAVASVAAPMSAAMAARCAPARPVSVLVVQGTLDDAYPYEGSRQAGRSVLGARATAAVWRALDHCPDARATSTPPDTARDGTRVLEERWPGCDQATEVGLVTVDGGHHTWSPSRDVSTAELVTAFFGRATPRRMLLP